MKTSFVILLITLIFSCTTKVKENPLFNLKGNETNIVFENTLAYTEDFNPYIYRNFYNGGGVALGDINNDGLLDIYFTGNIVNNKLYLNKGNWIFEDITKKAKVVCENVWSSGVTFVDINADGYLDIYVCKSGKPEGDNRHNELFINNGDLTFTEQSKEYGLDIKGLSVQAAFFDYDKDGDLDCYLLNNSIKSVGGYDLIKDQRTIPSENGNKLLENNNNYFRDVSEEKDIYNSAIGFGLGITLSDFNQDNWPDLFISNDFFEKDYLYLNEKGFRFNEKSDSLFTSTSMGSMGADAADLNNDLLPEIMVTEMLPKSLSRKKTKATYTSWDQHQQAFKQGYSHQYPRNILQKNTINEGFYEISRLTGTDATDWSWSSLLFDMNNDGLKDIFISNGIYKDLLDRDYLNYMSNPATQQALMSHNKEAIKKMIDLMPSEALPNSAYLNLGNFNFKEKADSLGLGMPSFSNGSVYGDLDNDGDLDLVVNNVNMPSFIYENKTDTLTKRFVKFRFKGINQNTKGIGAKVIVYVSNRNPIYFENFTSRGYQSAIAPELVIGVGQSKEIDSVVITWPNNYISRLTNIKTNKTYYVDQNKAVNIDTPLKISQSPSIVQAKPLFNFTHIENNTIDFKKEQLLDRMVSNEGPFITTEDINNDLEPDFYMSGAKGQSGQLFLSSKNGYVSKSEFLNSTAQSEDMQSVFFDSDNDGDLDLYITSGGKSFSKFDGNLQDRFYINLGNDHFKLSTKSLPFTKTISNSTVTAADFDKDGFIDLFVGERYDPEAYGRPVSGYILKNKGDNSFKYVQEKTLSNIGMITHAAWHDINQDTWPDLIIAGEWMPITILLNNKGVLENATSSLNLENTTGIWSALHLTDIDEDGDLDIIAGNIGNNYIYKKGTSLYFSDFDKNGKTEAILTEKINNLDFPILDKDELTSQLPHLKKKLLYFKDYGTADMTTIFDETVLNKTIIKTIDLTETTIFINDGSTFTLQPLPQEIQFSNTYAISSADINNDGIKDLLFGGNQYLIKPQFGKLDASKGWLLFGTKKDNKVSYTSATSLGCKGQIRDIKVLNIQNKQTIVIALNNEDVQFYEYKN